MKKFIWAEVKVGTDRRVTIGQDLVREVSWLTGSGSIEAWVLTLEPGRYRVIPNMEFETKRELKELLERFTALEPGRLETVLDADSPEFAVLPSRLLKVSISPPPSSWRLNLSSVPLLDPTGEDIKVLFLILRDGYIELWSGLRFAQAQNTAIEPLLR